MSKPVLGRGLDRLMNNGPKASATSGGAEREAPEAMEPKIGPGLGTLLSGVKASESDGQHRLGPALAPAGHSNLTLLKWSLLAADAVLVGLAVFLMLSGSSPLTPARIGTCVVALGLGAWLGCLAFWWQPQAGALVEGNSTAQPAGKDAGCGRKQPTAESTSTQKGNHYG